MKKCFKNALAGVIVLVIILSSMTALIACDDNHTYDPETRPVTFSISPLDGTFNPFFTTSATDSTIAHFTQVAMLSTSNEGQVACGEDEPTVALDYKITSYDSNDNPVSGGSAVDHTTYEFVIKNGMKFSDGVDLTIDDVLFNLYVYLDPMYSGSSTIYSVDIQGLKAYRSNDASLSDDSDTDMESTFRARASQRISDLVRWSVDKDTELTAQMSKDIEAVKAQLKKDLASDWTSNEGTLESSYKEYSFTEDWQSYYLIEGLISVQTEQNEFGYQVSKKDNNGKYVTELNDNATFTYSSNYQTTIENAANDSAKIAQYMSTYSCDEARAKELIIKDTAISVVYENYAGENSLRGNMVSILYGMSTGSTILDDWTLEEQSKHYKENSGGQSVKHISGISHYKTKSFKGESGEDLLNGEEHDVLSITINGIDPKAIWSFAYAVAPMHYYSDNETLSNKTDYPYGVRARDKEFFDKVLNSAEKNALPVGAGAYRASNEAGNASENPAEVKATDFWKNKKVYFERNDYFETMGEGISNAKIRRLVYVEVSENNILNNLITESIDYGTPSAIPDNKNSVNAQSHLSSIEYKTNGYGYVGINPKFVKDLEVRQAIMMSFDTSSVIGQYYGGTMAEVIYRPITKLSWAYPNDATPYYAYDATGKNIEALVESAGYRKNAEGIYEKNGEKLEYKFTIAGDTTDHPAYQMFEKARLLLNEHGFKITVGTDVSALKKLATGNLAIWAAAWTSTIDPDMYQIYHKDSKTTNTKNWNYDEILNTDKYPREKEIVNDLSLLIDQGRETNNEKDRKNIYADALDLIMDLAVEFPTYQRNDLAVYNSEVINAKTLNILSNYKYSGPFDRVWEIDYN